MAPLNRATTLRDLQSGNNDDGGMPSTADNNDILAGSGAASSQKKEPDLHEIFHIPTLPRAEQARAMLERVVNEFRPIAKRRGYMVLSVSELCCCNDGLDFRNNNSSSSNKEAKLSTRQRKLKKVSNNIWGYNRTMWRGGGQRNNNSKVHTIHIRLRHAQDHNRFLPYEDVAGTLAHELSHCEHGPHDTKFYKLMDSILEEHATLMASSAVAHSASGFSGKSGSLIGESGTASDDSFTPFGGQGHKLGENDASSTQQQQQRKPLGRGYTLGGDASFVQWMTPREAAVAAALARQRQQQMRLRGNRCCRPCVVTRGGDSDQDEDEEVQIIEVEDLAGSHKRRGGDMKARKRPATLLHKSENEQPRGPNPSKEAVIDLTDDDSPVAKVPSATIEQKWVCRLCTFINASTKRLNCEICTTPNIAAHL